MVETISPAVCGTRRRTALALTLFAAGSIGVAARSACCSACSARRRSCPSRSRSRSPACCASRALIRLPVPQSRRQVPERWHHELPLPVWSLGYGAGLGVGVLTYQPVATFLVVAVAAAASGTHGRRAGAVRLRHRPRRRRLAALGLHRSDGDALPPHAPCQRPRPGRPRAGPVRRACGRGALALGPGSQLDPAVADDGTLAYTQRADTGTTVGRRPCRRPARR